MKKKNRLVSIQEIASDLRISERKAHMFIQDFNYFGKKNGVLLQNKRNDGYILNITDEKKLQKFKDSTQNQISFVDPHHRQLLIQIYLIKKSGYTSVNELSDYVGASKSTISADLKYLNSKMKNFQLEIVGKTYYGMEVIGSELNKRLCLIKALSLLPVFENNSQIEDLIVTRTFRSAARYVFGNHDIILTETVFLSIIQYITIMVARLKDNQQIDDTPLPNKLTNDTHFQDFSEAIKRLIKEQYDIDLPEQEQKYLINYIIDQTLVYKENDADFDNYTVASLKKTDDLLGLHFSSNHFLRVNLSRHLLNLKSRINYGSQILFPKQKQFYLDHLFAILLTRIFLLNIQKDIDFKKITIDEVLYIAVYFEAALLKEQNTFDIYQKNVVVLAESRSLGFFLKEKLQHLYPSMSVAIFDDINISSIREKIKEYDLVITTKSISHQERLTHPSIIEIKDFLSHNELTTLRKKLFELFEWDTFKNIFSYEKNSSENIERQTDFAQEDWNNIILEKCPFILIDNFLTLVIQPCTTTKTFVEIQHLKNPLIWKNKRIVTVMTVHYQEGSNKQLKLLCDVIQILYADVTLRSQFKNCRTLEDFLTVIQNAFSLLAQK